MIPIERNPSRKQLIVFGILWFVFFSFWGTAVWQDKGLNWLATLFWSAAIVIPAAGSVWSVVLRTFYVAAAYITFPIGMIISSVILMLIYYLVLTPIGVVLRLAGYDPMKRNFDCSARTYWSTRKPEVETERYFKQF
jgi:hypothetical protein